MRLIDANALIKAIPNTTANKFEKWSTELLDREYVIKLINDAPTIDAEPIRNGHWIYCRDRYADHKQYQCSECGKHMWSKDKYLKDEKYCFNCGAKMKGE